MCQYADVDKIKNSKSKSLDSKNLDSLLIVKK